MPEEIYLPAGSLHYPHPIRMIKNARGQLEIAPGPITVNPPAPLAETEHDLTLKLVDRTVRIGR